MLWHRHIKSNFSKCLKYLGFQKFFENYGHPAEKTEIFNKSPVQFWPIIFINFLSLFFWPSGQGSELQIQGSWVQSPLGGKSFFEKCFCGFFDKYRHIPYSHTQEKT